jgi:outer membrane biosynthesis protein TonB
MTRRTALTVLVVGLVMLAGCSTFVQDPIESTPGNGTATATDTPSTTAMVTAASTATATPTATATQTTTETSTATPTATATPIPTETETPTETPTPTPTETPTETETLTETLTETTTETPTESETPTETETSTETPTATATATPTDEPAASVAGPEPPLDPEAVADAHVEGLRAAGSFAIADNATIEGAGESRTNDRSGQVNLDANTARLVSKPTEEATRYTYAEGAMAYEKTVFDELDQPQYEVSELGRPLAESLLTATEIAETVRAVDYERSGTLTRDGQELAVYVANGTDSLDTDVLFRGEGISEFSSTLVINPETGVVRTLKTERTTDALSADGSNTITETLRFSDIGSTEVDQPAWVDDLKQE